MNLNELTQLLHAPQSTRRAAATVAATIASAAKQRADALIPEEWRDWVRWAWSGDPGTDEFHAWWSLEEDARRKAERLS